LRAILFPAIRRVARLSLVALGAPGLEPAVVLQFGRTRGADVMRRVSRAVTISIPLGRSAAMSAIEARGSILISPIPLGDAHEVARFLADAFKLVANDCEIRFVCPSCLAAYGLGDTCPSCTPNLLNSGWDAFADALAGKPIGDGVFLLLAGRLSGLAKAYARSPLQSFRIHTDGISAEWTGSLFILWPSLPEVRKLLAAKLAPMGKS
jgi:hypothetical protein